MKLTTQQITKIDETLVLNGLIYDDIKIEVTDHIASEIEAEMIDKSISFEVAFKQAFENWEEQLRPSYYSFWIRRKSFKGPRIVVEKCVSFYKSTFYTSAIIPIPFTLVCVFSFQFFNQEFAFTVFSNTLKILYFIEILLISIGWLLILTSKGNTTFSYYFKKSSYLVYFQPLFFLFGVGPEKLMKTDIAMQIVLTYFLISMGMFFLSNIVLIIKHYKTQQKLNFV